MNNYPNFYTKYVNTGDRYLEVSVEEKVCNDFQIMRLDEDSYPFDVIATGAYGQIQIRSTNGNEDVFYCSNPFRHGEDRRLRRDEPYIAKPMDEERVKSVIDITHAKFTMSAEEMGQLHDKYYLPRKGDEYWVMLEVNDKELASKETDEHLEQT